MKLAIAVLLVIGSLFVVNGQPPYVDCVDVAYHVGPVDGWYPVIFPSGNKWIYCLFKVTTNTAGWAWSLFESARYGNAQFDKFGQFSFNLDYPQGVQLATGAIPTAAIFKDTPDTLLKNYRWSREDIFYYRGNTSEITHWAATCQGDTDFSTAPDFWYVSMKNYSFSTWSDLEIAQWINCPYYAIEVSVRGYKCSATPPCNVAFYTWVDLHPHVDGNLPSCTGHLTPTTEFQFKTSSTVNSEDSFGTYFNVNPLHLCSAANPNTGQYWMINPYLHPTRGPTSAPIPIMVDGDPHFLTLDGFKFKYDGPCSYMLSTNKCGKSNDKYPLFEVISHHGRCRKRWRGLVCMKKVTLNFWKSKESKVTKIEIESHESVSINGYKMNLPYHDADIDATVSEYETKGKTYNRVKLHVQSGMGIMWTNDAAAVLQFSVPKDSSTCGLLGNNNGNKDDDLLMKDGTLLEYSEEHAQKIFNKMGDSWMIPTPNQVLRCNLYPKHSMESFEKCTFNQDSVKDSCENMLQLQLKKLKGKKSAKCFPTESTYDTRVDETRIYDDCVTEVCACKKDLFKDCVPKVAIQEFEEACTKHGVTDFPTIKWDFE